MSHRVRRGTCKEQKQTKRISAPERENIMISKLKPLCGSKKFGKLIN
jgi:hypothetical protein